MLKEVLYREIEFSEGVGWELRVCDHYLRIFCDFIQQFSNKQIVIRKQKPIPTLNQYLPILKEIIRIGELIAKAPIKYLLIFTL